MKEESFRMPDLSERLGSETATFRQALAAALPYTIPVMTGYIFLGTAFGVLLASKGFGCLWALLISLTVYAGSMQFVMLDILTSPFNFLGTLILTLTINGRHLFYGLSLIDKYRDMGRLKPYMIFSLSDETYSLICGITPPPHVDGNKFYFSIAMMNQLYWLTGTLIGSAAGSLITFNTKGIDFTMTALFVVIFIEQWEKSANHIPAIAGVVLTLSSLVLVGERYFIIAAMAAILACLTLLRPVIESEEKHK